MMNITLSADDEVIEKARLVAQRQGTSLNELVRRYLRSLAGEGSPGAEAARELLDLIRTRGGHSGGRKIHRDEAYENV